MDAKKKQLEENYQYFKSHLPSIILEFGKNKFVLIKDQKIVESFDTESDAIKAGQIKFEDGLFSIQQTIEDDSINLGFYSSYASH